MTPARRLAKEVKVRAKLPGARFDDLLPLCETILRKPRSPASRWKPELGPTQRERSKTRAEARRATRPACVERDGGCAVRAIGGCGGLLHHDHFFGRGRKPPDPRWEWMLCEDHDWRKTNNRPSHAAWIEIFRLHAQRYDYRDVVAECDGALALELAQHPEAQRAGNQQAKEG